MEERTIVWRVAQIGTRAGILALAGFALLSGCSGDDGTGEGEAFSLLPNQATLLVGEGRQFTAIDAPTTPDWSSSNSQVASVIRETGFVTGVSRGTATISALAGGAVASAAVLIEIEPAIGLSTPTVAFENLEGGSLPPSQTVSVANTGDRTLSGLTLGSTQYGQGETGGWLVATLTPNTAPATLTLGIGGPPLPRGTYTATVPVSSGVATNSPQTVVLTYSVRVPPTIGLQPTSVSVAAIPGETASMAVAVSNDGDFTLSGLSASVSYQGTASGWLAAALSSSQAPATLTLVASAGSLAVGTYDATVTLASTVAGVAPVDLPVEFVVNPGPAIALSRTSASFNAIQGSSPGQQTVNVTNAGGGTLTGLAASVTTAGASWLSVSLDAAVAPTTLRLDVSSSSLAAGTYSATVRVSSGAASNSPQDVSVTLTVGPPPVLTVSTNSVSFSSWQNATIDPGSQAVAVTNTGGGTISGLVAVVQNGGAWLTAAWQSGNTTAPAVLILSAATGSLTAGTYNANVIVSAPGVSPQTVSVTFLVQSFSVVLPPLFTGCGFGCHNGSESPTLTGGITPTQLNTALQSRITPGNPNAGILICKITVANCNGSGTNMTMTQGPVNTIKSWIAAGAPFS